MPITLTWKQKANQTLDSIEIYRISNPRGTINPNNPGTPLAVLPGNATSYEDNTVENYKTYQYRIVSVKGTDKVFGFPVIQGYFPHTGPGPQKIIRGDWYCGYFGTIDAKDFIINSAEMNALAGVGIWNQNPVLFHKFVYKNRILFFPDTNTNVSQTYNFYYQNGFAWGTPDNGKVVPSGLGVSLQRKTVIKNGYEYVVRLPYLFDYDAPGTAAGSYSSYTADGEWFNTMCRLWRYSGSQQRFDDRDLPGSGGYNTAGSVIFAHMWANSAEYQNAANSPEGISNISNTSGTYSTTVLELVLN
ncbi:hypothetical protein pEaSNUABM29_00286 [Erwinia phage pEa_SNUABM_29]|nr:hypothetical protein pEaSNUABM29_00286 [Erwinia phage pEa_SNUABM_29]